MRIILRQIASIVLFVLYIWGCLFIQNNLVWLCVSFIILVGIGIYVLFLSRKTAWLHKHQKINEIQDFIARVIIKILSCLFPSLILAMAWLLFSGLILIVSIIINIIICSFSIKSDESLNIYILSTLIPILFIICSNCISGLISKLVKKTLGESAIAGNSDKLIQTHFSAKMLRYCIYAFYCFFVIIYSIMQIEGLETMKFIFVFKIEIINLTLYAFMTFLAFDLFFSNLKDAQQTYLESAQTMSNSEKNTHSFMEGKNTADR